MPKSDTANRAFARTMSSWNRPTAAKTGARFVEIGAGFAVCATTQIEHEAASVCVGWQWVDSAAAVHNISDSDSHAHHLTQLRKLPASRVDFDELTLLL